MKAIVEIASMVATLLVMQRPWAMPWVLMINKVMAPSMVNSLILELDVLGFRQLPAWDAPDDQGHLDRSMING
jgi:hypothetical protein